MSSRVETAVLAAMVLATISGCGGSTTSNSSSSVATSPAGSAAAPHDSMASPSAVGWVTRSFGKVTLMTPSTWAPVELRAGKLVTDAKVTGSLRKGLEEDLKEPGALGSLIDNETLRGSFFEQFITEILVSSEPWDGPAMDTAELVTFARTEVYVGPDAPKDVKISAFDHPTVPAIQARYTAEQDGFKVIIIEYTLVFPGTVLHLDMSTDRRNPGPDIATAERIVRSANIR